MRHEAMIDELVRTVLDAPGERDRADRVAAFAGEPQNDAWTGYIGKVREASYQLTDADVDALRSTGLSEDAIFEMTIAAALGAAKLRFDAGARALTGEVGPCA